MFRTLVMVYICNKVCLLASFSLPHLTLPMVCLHLTQGQQWQTKSSPCGRPKPKSNITSTLVLWHSYQKENYRLYTLPYTLPLAQTSMVSKHHHIIAYVGYNVMFIVQVMSCYMTLSLTVERYISVVHPLLRLILVGWSNEAIQYQKHSKSLKFDPFFCNIRILYVPCFFLLFIHFTFSSF